MTDPTVRPSSSSPRAAPTPSGTPLPTIVAEYDDERYHWVKYEMYENLTDVVQPAARINRQTWRLANGRQQAQLREEAVRRDVRRNNHLFLSREEAIRNMELDSGLPADDSDDSAGGA